MVSTSNFKLRGNDLFVIDWLERHGWEGYLVSTIPSRRSRYIVSKDGISEVLYCEYSFGEYALEKYLSEFEKYHEERRKQHELH